MNGINRWNDLEAQFDRAQAHNFEEEAHELALAEQSAIKLGDRIAGAVGDSVRIGIGCGRIFEGEIRASGRGWLQMRADAPVLDVLVNTDALQFLEGKLRKVREEGAHSVRLPMTRRLEALMRTHTTVNVVSATFELQGRIVRVGADHIDVVSSETPSQVTRRGKGVVAPHARVIPLSSLEVVYAYSLGAS